MITSKVRMFFLFTLIAAAALMIVLSGCKKKENKILYVGTNAEFPPFEYLDNNIIVGFDIDLINAVAAKIGRPIEIKNMSFDGLLPALQSGKIDVIIAGMTADEERRKSVNFSDPYFVSNQSIIVSNDNNDIKTFEDLPNKNVGVILGFTGDLIVSKDPAIKVQRYNGNAEAVMALRAKKIDAVVLDFEPAKNYVKQNEGLKLLETDLEKEEYAIAVRKEETKLTKEINDALKALRADGTYDKLLNKYFENKQ